MMRVFRVFAIGGAAIAASLALSSCVGGPTYGTDKTAVEQLADDLSGVVAFAPEQPKNLTYQPRPTLVVPPKDQQASLVQPQQSLADSSVNPQWVESPEQARERLREEADTTTNPNYVSPLARAPANARNLSAREQQEQYRAARRIQQGAYSDKRRFLSDPPLEYRRLPQEATADLGEPEAVKARRRKKEAEIANTGKKWWNPF